MRIVDYLNSDDDVGGHHETAATDAPILNDSGNSGKNRRRKLVSRLFTFTWKCGGGRVTRRREHKEMEEQEVEQEDEAHLQQEADSDGILGRICEECRVRIAANQNLTPGSGCHEQELNFNLVAGLGLLSLVAVNKMELEKAVELRRQMESFFQNLKEGCQSKNNISEPSESEISRPNDRSPEVGTTSSEITSVCDRFSKSDTDRKEDFTEGKNQFENLEEELETELELLQLHLQTEESSSQHQWQIREPNGDSEMVYNQQADEIEQCGVNPYELERRLHELLEARQEERIRELESALKQTKQMIQEHEIEASWLKDTTVIISKHLPESSSVSR